MSILQALTATAVPAPIGGGLTIDNVTSVSFHQDNGPSKMHVVGASANYLMVIIADNIYTPTFYWFNYNNVPMTPIVNYNAGGAGAIVIYGLANPDVGNHAVSLAWAGGSGNPSGVLGVYSFNGASSVDGFVHSTVDCVSPAAVDITSAVGSIVVDILNIGFGNTMTPDASQTLQFSTFDGSSGAGGPSSTKPGAASVAMSWAIGGCPFLGAVSVNP